MRRSTGRIGVLAAGLTAVLGLVPAANAAVFHANPDSLGPVPQGANPGCGPAAAPLDVTFSATGLPAGAATNVEAQLTFSPLQGWAGDVVAVLIAPNGATHTLFGRTGATDASSCGDSSDLAGPYTFADSAAGDWWQVAGALDEASVIPAGRYRTTNSGGAGATNPMPPTSITQAFAGLTGANGTWILRVTDVSGAFATTVSAASLTIDVPGAGGTPPPVDTTAPETNADKGPKKAIHKRKAKFEFSSSEAGSTFECALDKKPFAACASPKKVKRLKDGKHRFLVRAIDAAGNADATPASWKFKVELD